MNLRRRGWTALLRQGGPDFLVWLKENRKLTEKFNLVAAGLSEILKIRVHNRELADQVWEAAPCILTACDDPATYDLPGSAPAYAWWHFLDRYVRTWRALELLVSESCLPMGKNGVNTLDVGTGPGPSVWATNDFYASMTEYSRLTRNAKWGQNVTFDAVEINPAANSFRHELAEVVFDQSNREFDRVFATIGSIGDFSEILPTIERRRTFEGLRDSYIEYFDEIRNEDVSELEYLPDEAHEISQSKLRYRLITFSNFLTHVCTVVRFQPNLVDLMEDAAPGTVVMIIGGLGKRYRDVNRFLDELAAPTGFERVISDKTVTTRDSEVANSVYSERKRFYEHLQHLSPNDDWKTEPVRKRFAEPQPFPPSGIRTYRKYRN